VRLKAGAKCLKRKPSEYDEVPLPYGDDEDEEITDFSPAKDDPPQIAAVLGMNAIDVLGMIENMKPKQFLAYLNVVTTQKNLNRMTRLTRPFVPELHNLEVPC